MALAETLGCQRRAYSLLTGTTPKPTADGPPPSPSPPPDKTKIVEVLAALNVHLKTLHASLPPRTAFIIITGHSDPCRMALLNAFETAIRQGQTPDQMTASPWGSKWTAADDRGLEEAVCSWA